MGVEFDWLDTEKTIMQFTASPPWNWKDYYRAVKIAAFRMHNLGHQVDIILDLRRSNVLPAGAIGHLRGVGKPTHQNMTGRAVIVGVPLEIEQNLTPGGERVLRLGSQTVYFADSDIEALTLLHQARVDK